TGQIPLSATDRMAYPGQFKTVREVNAQVSDRMNGIIDRAMALACDQRWSDAATMRAAFEGYEPRSDQASVMAQLLRATSKPVIVRQERTKRLSGKSRINLAWMKSVPAWAWVGGFVLSVVILLAMMGVLGSDKNRKPPVVVDNTPALTLTPSVTVRPSTSTPRPTPTPTSQPTPGIGSTRVRAADGMTMIFVPAGSFEMGSDEGADDEKPVHTVSLDAFWFDQTQVTNSQFRRCVEAGVCSAPVNCEWGGVTYDDSDKADHPVVCVSWNEAQLYCTWADARLPTEAQWEYAGRGPENLRYPWGNERDCTKGNFTANCGEDSYDYTAPVGSFPEGASWCKALDMGGFVWEWTADWYDLYQSGVQVNPSGPESGESKVFRGGSATLSKRYKTDTATSIGIRADFYSVKSLGFRCAVLADDGGIAPVDTPIPTLAVTLPPVFSPTLPPLTPTPGMTPVVHNSQVRESDGMTMVYVPAGEFEMGGVDTGSMEQPVHTVVLDAFWFDRTEVTNAQYSQCVAAGVCGPSGLAEAPEFNGGDYPVGSVSWEDATAYCIWVGARLPTEAEWEYAARGPQGWRYPWGNEWRAGVANCDESVCKDGFKDTSPVDHFREGASWCGALGLYGNMMEWVGDWYDVYSASRQENPTGPATGEYRVVRGSNFAFKEDSPSSKRHVDYPGIGMMVYGFRCAMAAP
ncbi:MAG: SUMF1/EgtB/PvdO family nonheme iron enzyme, partial [Anaerolineae bacterium]|nr:SUMF1/EgtB/PvdO family nonheme iron enzyme [Anaerolineae bacterium]